MAQSEEVFRAVVSVRGRCVLRTVGTISRYESPCARLATPSNDGLQMVGEHLKMSRVCVHSYDHPGIMCSHSLTNLAASRRLRFTAPQRRCPRLCLGPARHGRPKVTPLSDGQGRPSGAAFHGGLPLE